MYNSLLYKPEKEREIFIICKRRSVWQDKTWWACLWVVGGGRWGRHLLTTPASNQLQPHTTTTTLLPPSCFPEVKLNSNMQQLVAFCIFGGFGLCCAVAELSRLFFSKPYIISLLALYDFHSLNKHTHSEFIWISFFAGSSIWASGARRRWRPSTLTMPWTTCEQFPLLSKMDSLGLPRFLDLDNFKDARSSGPPAKSTCQKTTRSRFFMSLVLCISGSLNLAALDIF